MRTVLFFLCFFVLISQRCSTGRSRELISRSQIQPPKSIVFSWPLTRIQVSSYYGWRKGGRLHDGIDLRAPRGERILASESGRVIQRGWIRGYGRTIIIDHGNGWSSLYAHLSAYKVMKGQLVKQGQIIGVIGNSGHASGVHLHFEIRKGADPLDPLTYLPRLN